MRRSTPIIVEAAYMPPFVVTLRQSMVIPWCLYALIIGLFAMHEALMSNYQPYRRKPLRLSGYDYTQVGAYFVTICTRQRRHLFGVIENGIPELSSIGQWAERCWQNIPAHYGGVELDAFVIMPNHVHGMLHLPGDGASLGTIVGTYKAAVSRQARRVIPSTPRQLWQTLYHEHIVRDDRALQTIRAYIVRNPLRWQQDSVIYHTDCEDRG
jgi:putative transposase